MQIITSEFRKYIPNKSVSDAADANLINDKDMRG